MSSPSRQPGGVAGTIGAFNFIRRVSFPSFPEVVSIFCTLVVLSSIVALPVAGLDLASAFWFAAFVIIAPALVGELVNTLLVLRKDPVLDYRRLVGLEILSWWTLTLILPVAALLGQALGNRGVWVDGFLLALAVSLPLRFLTIFSISSLSVLRKVLAAVLVPAATVRAYFFYAAQLGPLSSSGTIFAGVGILASELLLSGIGVFLIIRNVERSGSPLIRDSPMGLFRAFLQHWLNKDPKPLEERLAALGSAGEVETSILAFSDKNSPPKGCIVVSNFHPGPYRDLGSGGLPSTLKSALERAIGGIALVPHGISNHEYNIISRDDIEEMVHEAKMRYPSSAESSTASEFVREEFEGAKASAQLFGKTVLVTLTLAPQDMEDIPGEVLNAIRKVASEKGLRVVAIDAHNSLSGQASITPDQARELTQAGIKVLTSVTRLPQGPFKLGAASDPLGELGLEDGIGPGGLSVIVVQTRNQIAAYVLVDGNNMQNGVRELILRSLKEAGVDEGEVMTTDTHLVTGLVRSPLGYHPVGEGLNKELLTRKVKETVQRAVEDLEEASTGFSDFKLNLRVLGSDTFSSITSFVSRVAGRIGRSFFRLELVTFIVALVVLALL